jgi:hypothetical protein
MKTRHHIILATLCISIWGAFYLLGVPYDYFQNFSKESNLLLLIMTFVCILPVIAIVVLALIKVPFLRASLWLAFYGSVPLFVIDFIIVGVIGGEGLHFLVSHWGLALGYIAVWIVFPLIAISLEKLSLKIMNQNF